MGNRLAKIIIGFILAATLVIVGGNYLFKVYHPIEAKSVKIAIVDSARIKNQSVPFMKVRQLLEEQHAAAHKEILDQETQLRKEYESLKKSKDNPDKQKQKLELDKKGAELEKYVHKKQEKLTKQFSFLTEKLEAEFHQIMKEIAKEFEFNMILNATIQETQAILFADEALDITNEVIHRLDKKLPNLTLPTTE